jgi:hypothetical protein
MDSVPSNPTPVASPEPADSRGYDLARITRQPFSQHAPRREPFEFGGIATTELCNLSCVMCHFNGPDAVKKARELPPENVRKVLDQLPPGSPVQFAATGDFFMDSHAVEHVKYAIERGLKPMILSHGQLYTPELLEELLHTGVRDFRISCDAIEPIQYARIRRGGELQKILDAIAYLNERRPEYPGLVVEINCTLFRKTFRQQRAFEEFWSGKVDRIGFNSEYHDTWRFRNLFNAPEKRNDCVIQTYVLPSGKIAPCCAMMVHAHDGEADWLPDVKTHTLKQAYDELCDMYDDPQSPLGKLCANCDWWILWAPHVDGATPYNRQVQLPPVQTTSIAAPQPAEAELRTVMRRIGKRLASWLGHRGPKA